MPLEINIVNPELFNSELDAVDIDGCRGSLVHIDKSYERVLEINGEIVLYYKNGETKTLSAEYGTWYSDSFLHSHGFMFEAR